MPAFLEKIVRVSTKNFFFLAQKKKLEKSVRNLMHDYMEEFVSVPLCLPTFFFSWQKKFGT